MGLLNLFKKRKDKELDPLKDLELSKLKVGFFVDFDMKTWQVTAYNRYDFGDGYTADEWELSSGDEKIYLERTKDDEVVWRVSKKIPLKSIEGNIALHIIENDEPPAKIIYNKKPYYLDETGAGYFYEGGMGSGREFIYWDFIDENDESFVTIEQWGETDFEGASGYYVEEYQFTNILPWNKQ